MIPMIRACIHFQIPQFSSCLVDLPVIRNLLQKIVGLILLVDFAAIVKHPVGDNQKIDLKFKVVPDNLVENLLADSHLRSLAFDHQQRLACC